MTIALHHQHLLAHKNQRNMLNFQKLSLVRRYLKMTAGGLKQMVITLGLSWFPDLNQLKILKTMNKMTLKWEKRVRNLKRNIICTVF